MKFISATDLPLLLFDSVDADDKMPGLGQLCRHADAAEGDAGLIGLHEPLGIRLQERGGLLARPVCQGCVDPLEALERHLASNNEEEVLDALFRGAVPFGFHDVYLLLLAGRFLGR